MSDPRDRDDARPSQPPVKQPEESRTPIYEHENVGTGGGARFDVSEASLSRTIAQHIGDLERNGWGNFYVRDRATGQERNLFNANGGAMVPSDVLRGIRESGINYTPFDKNYDGELTGRDLTDAMRAAAEKVGAVYKPEGRRR